MDKKKLIDSDIFKEVVSRRLNNDEDHELIAELVSIFLLYPFSYLQRNIDVLKESRVV